MNSLLREVPHYGRAGFYWQVFIIFVSLIVLEWLVAVPGIAIGILALVAIIVAIRAERSWGRVEQVVWIAIAFALFIVEIVAIRRDRREFAQQQADVRKEENNHHEQQMSKIEQLTQTQQSLLQVNQAQLEFSSRKIVPLATKQDLRTRSLNLARKILQFVLDRQQNDPFSGRYPNYVEVIGGATNVTGRDKMPAYGRETLSLFANKFDAALQNIRDEFSIHGLGGRTMLDTVAQAQPAMINGNPYSALREVADEIRKLALLVPPDELYKDVSTARLVQMASDEADVSEKKATDALESVVEATDGAVTKESRQAALKWFFYSDFRECCLNQIAYLRAEIIRRLGPSTVEQEEARRFSGMPGFCLTDMKPEYSINTVREYVPEFRKLIQKLKLHPELAP